MSTPPPGTSSGPRSRSSPSGRRSSRSNRSPAPATTAPAADASQADQLSRPDPASAAAGQSAASPVASGGTGTLITPSGSPVISKPCDAIDEQQLQPLDSRVPDTGIVVIDVTGDDHNGASDEMAVSGSSSEYISPNSLSDVMSDMAAEVIANESAEQRISRYRYHLRSLHLTLSQKNEYCYLFDEPVDHVNLGIPDYPVIIKNPMDLRTMGEKIDAGAYDSDPRLYQSDFDLMIDNCLLYNGEKSPVGLMGRKMREFSVKKMNPFFRRMGFCCGLNRTFRVRALACYARQGNECHVEVNSNYAITPDGEYSVCNDCYSSEEDTVSIFPNPYDMSEQTPIIMNKSDFGAATNNIPSPEPFVQCTECGRKMHHVCVKYLPVQKYDPKIPEKVAISADVPKYKCFNCCDPGKESESGVRKFTSSSLMPNFLSAYIQNKVALLHENLRSGHLLTDEEKSQLNKVRIRVVSTDHKVCKVQAWMHSLYSDNGNFPSSFPYTSKAIFAFQEQSDGSEVVFFGFHVNEYGDDAPAPNTRRVYLSYLDSVSFFQPKIIRTMTFQEIILSYFEYVKAQGFMYVSIWSCPPAQTDDYMFYAHPKDMKFPTSKRLKQWYERLLDKGLKKECICFYTDISRRAKMDRMMLVTKLPYMDGDLWPGKIEEAIEFFTKQEAEKRLQSASQTPPAAVAGCSSQAAAAAGCSPAATTSSSGSGAVPDSQNLNNSQTPQTSVQQQQQPSQQSQKGPAASRNRSNNGRYQKSAPMQKESRTIHELLNENILAQMRSKLDVFFDVCLQDPLIEKSPIEVIVDPDPDLSCPLLDGRESFLRYCRAEFNEFSDLRIAVYSTLRMLELVTHCQKAEAVRCWCDFMHDRKCSGCTISSCLKYKKKLTDAGQEFIKYGPVPTKLRIRDEMIRAAKSCLLHHVKLCDTKCGYLCCDRIKQSEPSLKSASYD